MIKTSIIVPVYNTAKYLKNCFESIYNQTQKEIEVIAINDGSTDDSLNVLTEIQQKHPDLIIYSQNNTGLGSARNKGIELATGDFIYFLDSDDCLKDSAMAVCYQYCNDYQLDIAMFDAEIFGMIKGIRNPYDRTCIITDQNTVISGENFANKYWWNTLCPSACLLYISACFIRKNKLMFLPNIYYEDNDFYCKAIPLAKRIMYVPEFLYRRRYREGSITVSPFNLRCAKDRLKMIQAINKQRHSSGMQAIMKYLKINFLDSLLVECKKSNLSLELEFIQEIYETVRNICGNDIENIDTYHDIKIWNKMIDIEHNGIIPSETKDRIMKRSLEIIEKTFSRIPMHIAGKYIGIYGTGVYADQFIDMFRKNIGEIKAKIIFIDSHTKTGKQTYRNYDIINIDDIGNFPLNCIVIASAKYEQEMSKITQEKYGERFQIIKLITDLHF